MAQTANGRDHIARCLGGDDVGRTGTGASVTYTTTTLTHTGAAFPASAADAQSIHNGGLVGHYVVSGAVYGVIIQSTATVLTVDYWHNATAPGTVGTTPSAAATYIVLSGGAPAWYIGMTELGTNSTAGSNSKLTSNGTTNSEIWASGGLLNRAKAAYSHTNGTNTYSLSTGNLTTNVNDPSSVTINRIGVFASGVTAAVTNSNSGIMLFETAVTSPPTLVTGDTVSITDTVTIS